MPIHREKHKSDVLDFLRHEFPGQDWALSLPAHGTGHESYFAKSGVGEYFIKLVAAPERYRLLASLRVTPCLVAAGALRDGTNLVIQEKIIGHIPTRLDFHSRLAQFAGIIQTIHHHEDLKRLLPQTPSDLFRSAGLDAFTQLEQRWRRFKHLVPSSAVFVEKSLSQIKTQIDQMQGGGLVASHNDPCNGNWLISADGTVYLLDFESMSRDDSALDLGALLWWYYPPHLRGDFLSLAGYAKDATIWLRMRIRMAMHCLNIILPREHSFDGFDASGFEDSLEDFRAVLAGLENPQGYDD